MTNPPDPLPPDVTDAIAKGNKVEAIGLLREQTGLSLVEAKQVVERHGGPSPRPLAAGGTGLTESARAALARGNKIEAIKVLREETDLGLKEAKEAVDAAEAAMPGRASGHLAPGEVPAATGARVWLWLLIAVGLAAAYGYFRFR
jgi:ribosomal protein L7/L12